MDKETILSTLTEKLGTTGFSPKTLQSYIDSTPLAEGVEPDDAYWQQATTFLKSMEGQYNHDVAERVKEQTAIKAKTPPAPAPDPEPAPDAGGGGSKALETVLQKLAEVEAKLNAQEEGRKQADLTRQVKALMKSKNATDAYVLDKVLQDFVADTKKPVEEQASALMEKYDAEYKACRGNGAAPRSPGDGAKGGKTALDKYFADKAKREGWGKSGSK